MNDLRYAFRQLIKSPGFTAVAILTLALGIGACTAIFSVVNGVLLQPLDYPQPDRIVVVRETNLPQFPDFSISPPNFLDWQKQAKSFSALAAYGNKQLNLTGEGEPQRLAGLKATASYFDVFGVRPLLGRAFLPEEDAPGKSHVVVLSHPLWERVFAGAKDALGRSLQLNGESYTVIGVMPPNFARAEKTDVWVPMAFSAEERSNNYRDAHYLDVAGRLKPDVTAAQANAELQLLAARLARQYPDRQKGWSVFVRPLLDYSVRDVRPVLYTLLGAVGCVLLIACANIANLLLARATARQRELSIRAALGAGRFRLVRQLLTESVLLGLCGGAAGLLVARWGLDALLALAPSDLPRVADIHLNAAVLLFSLLLSVITGVIFGVAPAWLAARTDVNEALKQGTRGSTDARGKLRGALVVAEVAFALVLLGGAGLLARSFLRLTNVDPGFNPAHATVLRLTLPEKKYEKDAQQVAFVDALLERLRVLPGVEAAGLTHTLPLLGDWVMLFNIEGRPAVAPTEMPTTNFYSVTPDCFRAMGIRLLRGRVFNPRDTATAPPVVIVNETLAKQYFPNENPLGKRMNIAGGPEKLREIVGIVADVKQYGIDQAATSQSYEPFAQHPFNTLNVVLRTGGPAAAVMAGLRPAVYAVDKDQPIGSIQPLAEIVARSIAQQRFAMTLLLVFAGVALVLAAIGIYGVMAYTVAQRRGEIGIRMALGAQTGDVVRLILGNGARLVGLGLLVGLAASFAATRALRSMLFQTSAADPLTLGAITLLLAGVALIACLLPAQRATRVNPIEALRDE
ncbi:MAG: ABC transporter permease [Chthoniobacterales bacterium]|nr:ABC transporter permease [Chthoniobacterales bacterium]